MNKEPMPSTPFVEQSTVVPMNARDSGSTGRLRR
jgi:hypothetical protein